MPRHARKRQKIHDERDVEPEYVEKDDEEKRLESLLFGTKFASSAIDMEKAEEGNLNTGGNDLGNLLDSDVSFFKFSMSRRLSISPTAILRRQWTRGPNN